MRPSWRSTRAWLILITVLIAGLAADLSTKSWAFHSVAGNPVILDRSLLLTNANWNPIPPHEGLIAIPGNLLHFRLVLNDGAVFGIGSQQRFFFIAFTFGALLIAGWIFCRHTEAKSVLAHIAIGLVLGGGLGNLYDRIFIGRVRDFLYIFPDRHLPFGWTWPGGNSELFPWIFNSGDVFLLTGMGLLMIHFWKQPNKVHPKHTTTDPLPQEKSDIPS